MSTFIKHHFCMKVEDKLFLMYNTKSGLNAFYRTLICQD